MKNTSTFVFLIFIPLIFLTGCQTSKKNEVINNQSGSKNMVTNKKIALIIAFSDFRDEEYFVPKQILEKAGYQIITVSNRSGQAMGINGGEAPVDVLLNQLNINDYEAIVFIGGPGALTNLDNSDSYKITQEAVKQNKVLASICISPIILAKAGLLQGKKATVWSSPLDKSAVKILEQNGSLYQKEKVVVDGKIITADGPTSAEEFGQAIIEILGVK